MLNKETYKDLLVDSALEKYEIGVDSDTQTPFKCDGLSVNCHSCLRNRKG